MDSSVAALLLLEQGYDVTGLFMKNWEEDDGTEYCTAIQDLADAQQVCDKLGIELNTVNFSSEYWDEVFEVFLTEYQAGRTPNPDILCNKHVKFKAFLDYAIQDLGADYIATGHYAQIDQQNTEYRLLKGVDPDKEQSYFLYTLGQRELSRNLFPIGHLLKSEIRGAGNKGRVRDITGKRTAPASVLSANGNSGISCSVICRPNPGDMQTPDGQVIGTHQGLMYYTLGQRQGLGIGGVKNAPDEPWYVLDKNLSENVLIVGQGHDHPWTLHDTLEAGRLDWCNNKPLEKPMKCAAKTRYRQNDQACEVEPLADGRCKVVFVRPQRAITPGQSVVFYQGEVCLGGGIIESRANSESAISTSTERLKAAEFRTV